ncbi:DUF192 domain-containing protein [Methylocella sp.]|uniref:DUF192 domain-containing protein n=1 Tax=Methylocella sp. TaxID=1978226 RepID=UPI003783ADA2
MPAVLFCCVMAAFVGLAPRAQEARAEEARAALEPLAIVTASGRHAFEVEVMRTEAGRERGLMFRRAMPQNHGMLFDFDSDGVVNMWMKNTLIPLDMIFIGPTGKVVALIENAEPLSQRVLSSRVPAHAVLEINGGVAARIGVKIGDAVVHADLGK